MGENIKIFLEELNPWWLRNGYRFDTYEREQYISKLEKNAKLIDILVGARRVGKTHLLRTLINNLLDKKTEGSKILFIQCDTREVEEYGLKTTIDFYFKKFNYTIKDKLYIFLDEIQEVDGWQKDIKFMYDNGNIKFFLTGSSSLILSDQISKLTGRFYLHHILPLSFREFIEFQDIKAINENVLEDYLVTGGYPEYVKLRERKYIIDSVESTLYRELTNYYGIRNPNFLKTLLGYLADKVGTYVSSKKIKADLGVSDITAKLYLEYLENVFLIFPVYKKGSSFKITKSSVPKYYFNDTGVLSVFGINPKIGTLVENAVFLNLLRKSESNQISDINYYLENGVEVDFATKKDLFEVKYRTNVREEDLARYQLINSNINFIIKEYEEAYDDILPQHKKIKLIDFLCN